MDSSNDGGSSPPSSPLSVLTNSPSLPSSSPMFAMADVSNRYPSPSSTAQSGSASPLKLPSDPYTADDEPAISVRTDGPPPAKRRRTQAPKEPKERKTEYLDLEESLDEESEDQLARLLKVLRKKKKIVVVAGAGISVSAGIPDFRSSTGLFTTLRGQHKLKGSGKHLFDASVYKHDESTESFHKMVRELAHMTQNAAPTPFHHLLASLAHEGRLMRLYTQNVDCIDTSMPPLATNVPLNTKGPWPTTIQLHGSLEKMVCSKCHDLSPFDGSQFEGPEAPLCKACTEQEHVRTTFGGKRSRGVGRMRPRMVLYNEFNPDADAIGSVSEADLKRVPDAVVVVGTSLKIPGIRRLVKELCQVTRSRRDGFTCWMNLDPEPQGVDFKDCWDLVIKGKCDDVATLAGLPYWDQQDIADDWKVTGDAEKEQQYQEKLAHQKLDIIIPEKFMSTSKNETAAITGPVKEETPEPAPKLVIQLQAGIPTPGASPKLRTALPSGPVPKGKGLQSKLSFTAATTTSAHPVEKKPVPSKAKAATKPTPQPRKPRQLKGKKAVVGAAAITSSFKTTKHAMPSPPPRKDLATQPTKPSDLDSSPLSSLHDFTPNLDTLPPLRIASLPRSMHKSGPIDHDQSFNLSSDAFAGMPSTPTRAPTEGHKRSFSAEETTSPTSGKPRGMESLID